MSVVSHQDVCAGFFHQLRHASSRLLLLDYDGTLAPFTRERDRAFPYPGIPELVATVVRTGTRVVLISGRSATQVLFLIGIHPHPEIWGSHGAERLMSDGSYHVDPVPTEEQAALESVAQKLEGAGLASQMEVKPGGIAVHWRGLSPEQREPIEAQINPLFSDAASKHRFYLLPFDGGLELRAKGKDKGDAVSELLAEAGTGVVAAYLGDDQTDEYAFRAIKGRGLSVLVRPEPRPTEADLWLRPPDELSRFLQDWIKVCGVKE